MIRKINRGTQSVTPTTSGSSNSSGSALDDAVMKLKVPTWDILEATLFVLDAALTACAHGRLSPRELATGLKDLADFLSATLATIVSYFSAEVTRGIWKPEKEKVPTIYDWPDDYDYRDSSQSVFVSSKSYERKLSLGKSNSLT